MRARNPRIPTQWLMTDERMGDRLWDALYRMPQGGGVIFRHYSLDRDARRLLYRRVSKLARRRRLTVLVAGSDYLGRHSAGIHGPSPRRVRGIKSCPAHDMAEIAAARRAKTDIILISPVFATRSHPGAKSLGIVRAAILARHAKIPAIALGGVQQKHWRRLAAAGFYGWAAIDAWTRRATNRSRITGATD